MQRIGEVTAIRGDLLEITFCRPSDCEKCNACHGGQKRMSILIAGKASLGDRAVVEMPAETLLKASCVAYGLPLVGLLAGATLGTLLFPHQQDVAGLLGGILGLGLMLLMVRITEAGRSNHPQWKPQLIDILPRQQDA